MWQDACESINQSVAVIVRKTVDKKGDDVWRTVGTAFQISNKPLPTFLTCAHVLLDGHGRDRWEHVLISGFGTTRCLPAGIRIEHTSLELDAVVFVSGNEANCKSVSGFSSTVLTMGNPVAAIGFPLPKQPELYEKSGSLHVNMRFSAGYISSHEASARLDKTLYTLLDLKHYEMNMFCYPGLSGGPLFDLEANIVGMVRGTALVTGNHEWSTAAAYSYADRSVEIIDFLNPLGLI